MDAFQGWKRRHFGFFDYNFLDSKLSDFMDLSWNPTIREKVIKYLRQGIVYLASPDGDFHDCKICGKEIAPKTVILTDGVYVWPPYLWHYVEEHNIRLPDNFYNHILDNNYEMTNIEAIDDKVITNIFAEFFR